MAGFFSGIIDKITSVFKSKDLDTNITNFQSKMDTIINDLILPYVQPTQLGSNDRFRDLITLLDSKKCNKIAITLSSNLDKNYTKLQLEQFASSILVGKENPECKDESCAENADKTIDNTKTKVSKKEICNAVAIHYVKILNLIAAILTAVNPADNICLNRLRNLLTIINEDEKQGVSAICDMSNKIVKNSIMNEPGIKQLLMLYYYHLMQDTETDEEKQNVRSQYEFMVKTFSNLVMFVNPKLKNENESSSNSSSRSINNNIGKINNLVENKSNSTMNNNETQLKNTLNNIIAEKTPTVPENIVTTNNISKLKNNINSKLSNIKDEEKQNLQQIMDKIEGLGNIIEKIQKSNNSNDIGNSNSNSNNSNRVRANTKNLSNNSDVKIPMNNNINTPPMNTTPPPPPMNTTPPPMNTTTTPPPMNNTTTPPPMNNTPPPSLNTPSMNTPSMNTPSMNTLSSSNNNKGNNSKIANTISTNITPTPTPTPTPTTPLTNTNTSTPTTPESSESNSTIKEINNILKQYETETPNTKQAGGNNNNKVLNNTSKTNNNKNNNNNNNNDNDNNNNNNNNNKNINKSSNSSMNVNTNKNTNAPMNANALMNTNAPMNTNANAPMNAPMNSPDNAPGNAPMNAPMNTNANAPMNASMNNLSKNPLMKNFIDFVNSYANIDKVDDKVLEIVNTGFKTYSKFDSNNPTEKDMYIKEDDMTEFCDKNVNKSSMIPITLDDSRLSGYIKVYKDMKTLYIDNCDYLLSLLENNILVKSQVDEKNETSHFTIKNIGYSELVEVETDVRNKLVTMYAGCQEQYQKGIVALYNGLKVQEQ